MKTPVLERQKNVKDRNSSFKKMYVMTECDVRNSMISGIIASFLSSSSVIFFVHSNYS